jgi:hypothetical protein
MPSGVYERTPEHRAARLARGSKKRGKKSNGSAANGSQETVIQVAVDQLVKAAKNGDLVLARQWLDISHVVKDGFFTGDKNK